MIHLRHVRFIAVGLLGAGWLTLGGCPSNGNSNGNANANENSNSNSNGNSSGPGSAKVTITLHATTGIEESLRAKVWIGSRVVSRAEAADPATLRGAGFSDHDLDNTNAVGDLTREFIVAHGDVLTLIARESEGADSGPLSLPSAPAPLNSLVEFVNFSGAALVNTEPGVGAFTAGSDGEIIANFRRMPQIVLKLWGATGVRFDFDLPSVLEIPQCDNPNNRAFNANGYTAAPDAGVYRILQFKSNSQVTFTAIPNGAFVRWENACGGGSSECTLTFGGSSGLEDQTTTLVTTYLKCEFGGPPAYSGYTVGNSIDPRCTIITP